MMNKKEISTLGMVKSGVYQRLSQDPSLNAVINGVFDNVDEKTPYPYIVLGAMTGSPWGSKTSAGQEVTLTIHTWSDYPGDEEILIKIHPLILEAISREPIDVGSGLSVMLARLEMEETLESPDGMTRQGIIRFRFRIMEV
ncbi:DUF3168 domain-containing protein [Aeribacillus pallidus]|uniref:DUF3168 domain-containing protein n=1 Tax=Aeribacillus pallidus TaxID=33936 RepID=UPI003D242164